MNVHSRIKREVAESTGCDSVPYNDDEEGLEGSLLLFVARLYRAVRGSERVVSVWVLKAFLRELGFVKYTGVLQEEYDEFALDLPIDDMMESMA